MVSELYASDFSSDIASPVLFFHLFLVRSSGKIIRNLALYVKRSTKTTRCTFKSFGHSSVKHKYLRVEGKFIYHMDIGDEIVVYAS